MSSFVSVFLRGAIWNTGVFLAAQGFRFATNVVLARLLAPDLFGTMVIVNTLATGIELISDIGAGQNIISSAVADDPRFYNTVFTFQTIRGVLLWLALWVVARPIAAFYNLPDLVWIVPVTGIGNFFGGLTSPAREFLRKKLRFSELAIYEIAVSTVSFLCFVAAALISRTIWSLVIGGVLGSAFRMAGSYFLRAGLRLRFQIYRAFAPDILHFGKWIFLSSLAYFLSTNFDRLFFAKFVPLHVLGIFGIARSIADLVGLLVGRFGANVLFPYIASAHGMPRATLRHNLSPVRLRFLVPIAFGVAVLAATSDLLIRILYDQRYHEAMSMLPVLVVGSWFSILANANESALLGLGKPLYGALGNVVKLLFLVIGLPMGFGRYGMLGGMLVAASADVPRFLTLQIGQEFEQFSFAVQDEAMTLAMFAFIVALEAMRWSFGFGTSFDTLPTLVMVR
ncbi:MAG: oligosaccharide flippase family protein [Roseiarcus sp.]